MTLHPQAAAFLKGIEALGLPPIEIAGAVAARAARRAGMRPSTEVIFDICDLDAGGVSSRLYRAHERSDVGLLIYLHGGGWVTGDLDSHDNICRTLANESGHHVLSVDYRLAPEHPYPAALDDSLAAVRWAHANTTHLGCRADRIAIGGDSAGASLAAVIAQQAPIPLAFQLLVYPVTDCTASHKSYQENANGPFLTAASMRWYIDHYLAGNVASDDPLVSPIFATDAVLAATPSALVITAEYDPLRDEGDAYARRLAHVGVPTSHVRFFGMFHGFFSNADLIDDGKLALALSAATLAAALDR